MMVWPPTGAVEHVYDPWRYPDDWVVEAFAPEGPKVMRHGEWFYMITAVGGTAGPPTGHMVIVARSKSIHGPWENDPTNPIVRTVLGRGEMVVARACHAGRRARPAIGGWCITATKMASGRSAARRCSIRWNGRKDGWFRAKGGDLSQPIAKPAQRQAVAAWHAAVG